MSLEVYNYKIITTNTSELLLDSRNLMENLPEEILITIFSFLSPKLLKITTLVSRRWNQIISNSPKLMKHYLLNITSSRGNLNKIPNLTRKIESFHIDNLKKETFDILTIHNIRSLMFTECKLEKCELSAALKSLTKLESLELFGVKLNESTRNASVGIVYLKCLESLDIHQSDKQIINLISTNSLKVFIYRYGIGNENFTDLVNLIKNQQSLETLKILENNSDDLIQNKAFLNLPFKLKTFEIGKIESDSNLMTFLLLHQEKLINLSFICKLKAQNLLLLAKNFSQLERLTISCNFQCVSESKVEFSSKLKRLKLIGYLKLPQAQQLFTILFPSVTKVCFKDTQIDKSCRCFLHSHESFQEIRLTNIDDLFTVSSSHFPPNLTEIHVQKINFEFNRFIEIHSNTLKKISIGFINDDDFSRGTTFLKIANISKLHQISIGCNSPMITRMFRKIKWTHPWTFFINFKSSSTTIEIKFNFPDDLALFHDQCRTWDDELIREFKTVDNYGLNAFINQYK